VVTSELDLVQADPAATKGISEAEKEAITTKATNVANNLVGNFRMLT
jgi:hypothetical protein